MKKIVYTNDSGGLSVITPSPKWNESIEALAEKDVPAGFVWRIVDEVSIPTDRTYRDAWTDANPTETVDVDLAKAKIIQKENIRIVRKSLLETLDVEYQRADEDSDAEMKSAISAKKQNLRDFTNRVDLATTLDALKEILPNETAL
jgi:hypothetical protein